MSKSPVATFLESLSLAKRRCGVWIGKTFWQRCERQPKIDLSGSSLILAALLSATSTRADAAQSGARAFFFRFFHDLLQLQKWFEQIDENGKERGGIVLQRNLSQSLSYSGLAYFN